MQATRGDTRLRKWHSGAGRQATGVAAAHRTDAQPRWFHLQPGERRARQFLAAVQRFGRRVWSASGAGSGPTVVDIDAAVETLVADGAEALVYLGGQGAEADTRVAALALSQHLVNIGLDRFHPESGGLLSYGPDQIAIYRRGGYYVDRILKGAKPADLPVEFPTTFDLVVNQATARALGVTIPDELAQQVTSWI